MTKFHELLNLGQSVWYDNLRRGLLDSGEMQTLIDQGMTGVTSNPSIFEKAIAGSHDYDQAIEALAAQGCSGREIYESLVIEDIQRTADLFRPIYDRTRGLDGYVSLEVNPTLAHDTDGTIAEARRLFKTVDRPNLMIKVPGTREGLPAITTLIGQGINVNVTLMFSLAHYEAVTEAYLAGLEKLAAGGGDLSRVASVASFFVSRVDTAVDRALEAAGNTRLQGRVAVANSKLVYARFREIFSGPRWEKLAARGARLQRVLWASTSTKNPAYSDTLYVDPLIGPGTVNTMPTATVEAFLDHGTVARTVDQGLDEARAQLDALAGAGVDLDAITEQLQVDGVDAFAGSFEGLMASIAEKKARLLAGQRLSASLGGYQNAVAATLAGLTRNRVVARIWQGDHTVWKPDPTEIANRLGWLRSAGAMAENVGRLNEFAQSVRADGYTDVLLLGMGGSSLAPEVFSKVFTRRGGEYFDLAVLDSTDPGAVLAQAGRLDPAKTLFIVSTKSGGTVETLSFFKFFYNRVAEVLGAGAAGAHFVAITDPGSGLADLAARCRFRDTFLNDPDIGGRYSALSYFGLLPAALVSVDVARLLDRARAAAADGASGVEAESNPAAHLGAILGALAKAGRDKVTLVASPEIASFGDWVEQLVAESTGKEGVGILPVVGEPPGSPDVYGADRLFVQLKLGDDTTHDAALAALEAAGHPVVRLHLQNRYDLGGQFFLWALATAVAGHVLGINPFDQPDVEAAKVLARRAVKAYQQSGALPGVESAPLVAEALRGFLAQAKAGAYVALQAYVQPTDETTAALQALRLKLRDDYRLATTLGYGPRFLHSTGQLHKGDGGNGLFIQFTADDAQNAAIPDEAGAPESSISFGVLKMAQANGDRQALLDAGRRVIRFHLGADVVGGLSMLTASLM